MVVGMLNQSTLRLLEELLLGGVGVYSGSTTSGVGVALLPSSLFSGAFAFELESLSGLVVEPELVPLFELLPEATGLWKSRLPALAAVLGIIVGMAITLGHG